MSDLDLTGGQEAQAQENPSVGSSPQPQWTPPGKQTEPAPAVQGGWEAPGKKADDTAPASPAAAESAAFQGTPYILPVKNQTIEGKMKKYAIIGSACFVFLIIILAVALRERPPAQPDIPDWAAAIADYQDVFDSLMDDIYSGITDPAPVPATTTPVPATTTPAPVSADDPDPVTDPVTDPDPVDPAPVVSNTAYFEALTAEFARVDAPKRAGVSDNVAFWERQGWNEFYLHHLYTGETTFINQVWSTVYWNGNIYALMQSTENWNTILVCFDLQGNMLREFQPDTVDRRGEPAKGSVHEFTLYSDGTILFRYERGLGALSASDFSVINDLLKITVDIGHGRTEEIIWFNGITLYDGNVYVIHNREEYTINLSTGESRKNDPPRFNNNMDGTIIGKYHVRSSEITDLETGEQLANFSGRGATSFNITSFTGTSYYTINRQTVSKLIPRNTASDDATEQQSTEVFEAPNSGTTFFILNDEYLVVTDRVGTFLYKFADGNTSGELVTEIIRQS